MGPHLYVNQPPPPYTLLPLFAMGNSFVLDQNELDHLLPDGTRARHPPPTAAPGAETCCFAFARGGYYKISNRLF